MESCGEVLEERLLLRLWGGGRGVNGLWDYWAMYRV